MTPRVLFITSNTEDYLSDSLLHGLRTVLGDDVVDVPKRERLYNTFPEDQLQRIYGRGFGWYGLLDDIPIRRDSEIKRAVEEKEFDLVVIGGLWRSFGTFIRLIPSLDQVRVVVLDGVDSPAPYPYGPTWWRVPTWWFLPRAHRRVPYFKREISGWTTFFARRRLRPIAFSYPEEKMVASPPPKAKDLPLHIVDPEVIELFGQGQSSYAFEREEDYHADLRASRFGITTKRHGWDCLRHYEIAANGAVPCFRDLDRKPKASGPHGLDESNCITYHSADELKRRIDGMSDDEYATLQAGTMRWARANSTRSRAIEFLLRLGIEVPAAAASDVTPTAVP